MPLRYLRSALETKIPKYNFWHFLYEPINEPLLDGCFISTIYDATTRFESTVMDVLAMYTKITGKLAGVVTIDVMGGPTIDFVFGRKGRAHHERTGFEGDTLQK
ncbi:guanosine nucleotide diphosphate dissociation inhibitor At5g09550-like [Elaeis guineensis]|uniref:guanosine nucleotide diphosphate dissociation inhibitor At5g09550-like n=1 Tax=Elaeis guineensis var. tenera TaxID=51953 RepID=UPI003C6D8655